MKFEKLISRARLLVLVLPLFGLASTLHVGCSSNNSGGGYYYGYGYGGASSGQQQQPAPDPSNPFGE